MRETVDAKRKRARTIIAALEKAYPDAKCALNFTTPLELLVAGACRSPRGRGSRIP